MNDPWAQAEGERTQANMIRLGVITQLDAPGARVKAKVGGLDTDWLPWLALRAGATRAWSAPRPGEQVLILAPYGDLAQAVVLPGIYQADHPAPANSQDVEAVVFPDETRVEYNSETNTLQIDVAGDAKVVVNCKVATIAAATSVTLDTPSATITGDLVVEGNATFSGGSVTHGGKNIGKTHTHGGVQGGGGNTAAPN